MTFVSPTDPVSCVVDALERAGCAPRRNGRSWQALCPAHEDRHPSLSVAAGRSGDALLHCHAGCELNAIIQALGLDLTDLFASGEPSTAPPPGRPGRVGRRDPVAVRAQRPPRRDVESLWAACQPVDRDHEVAAWVNLRGLDVSLVVDRDLCRALPQGAQVPGWAHFRSNPWPRGGYRLLVPLYDACGRMASLHARNIHPSISPKGALPSGFAARGLVLADGFGLRILRGSRLRGELWIAEGVPDFLSCATAWGDAAEDNTAVLGVIAGSWTTEVAARVPDGARVVIAVHHDEAGERYLAAIANSLGGRCELHRWAPQVAK